MSELFLSVIFLVIGLFTGVLAGMLGIGGGIVFVPSLYILLPYTGAEISLIPYIAIGTSLLAAAFTSSSSFINHFIKKNLDKKKAAYLAGGSSLSALISTFEVVKVKPEYLQVIFAVVFTLTAIKMMFERGGVKKKSAAAKLIKDNRYLILFGLAAGALAAFAGVGGGIIFVPALIYFYGLEIRKAIGTSAAAVAATTIVSAVSYSLQKTGIPQAHFQTGYVYLPAALTMGAGAALGAYAGVKIVLGTSPEKIKKIFSAVLILAVLKIMLKL